MANTVILYMDSKTTSQIRFHSKHTKLEVIQRWSAICRM